MGLVFIPRLLRLRLVDHILFGVLEFIGKLGGILHWHGGQEDGRVERVWKTSRAEMTWKVAGESTLDPWP